MQRLSFLTIPYRTHLAAALFLLFSSNASASDHADPIKLRFLGRAESNVTGLFAFEQNHKLVIALCARPGLADKNVDLRPFRFAINIDVDSHVEIAGEGEDDDGRTFRYGGWVTEPEEISEDIVLTFDFNKNGRRNPLASAPLGDAIDMTPQISAVPDDVHDLLTKQMNAWVGIRDDPFIFHGFSRTNVVAMVVELPLSAVGEGPLLIWGTCHRHGKQIDHVGRSLRTMLPRFDYLNRLHPRDHVAAIRRAHESADVLQDVMSYVASPFFGIRHYDFEPDVMIYSSDVWHHKLAKERLNPSNIDINHEQVAFPNGRRLTDDVAQLMCERGDCLLYEVSTAEAHAEHKPRPTTNAKPFESRLPYLAAPNEDPMPAEMPSLRKRTIVIVVVGSFVGIALFVVFPWWLYLRERRRFRRAQAHLRAVT